MRAFFKKGQKVNVVETGYIPVSTIATLLPQLSCQFIADNSLLPAPTSWSTNRNYVSLKVGVIMH